MIRAAGRIPRQRTTLYGDARGARGGLVRRRAARRAAQPSRGDEWPPPARQARPARPRRRLTRHASRGFATVGADGRPHVVPICFALDGDTLYTAVDSKPKSTRRLRRLANIEANPAVEIVIDHWDEDWSRLWWVRLSGRARIVDQDARGLGASCRRSTLSTAPSRRPGPFIVVDDPETVRMAGLNRPGLVGEPGRRLSRAKEENHGSDLMMTEIHGRHRRDVRRGSTSGWGSIPTPCPRA